MSYDRKYLCPYCQKKIPKSKLITHLGRAHHSQLPEGFTALQAAYHIINNRPLEYRGKCRICSKPTFWDENKGRYNFLCGDPNCDKEWVNKMKSTMGNKYGAYRPTSTPEGLKKMLAARRISGVYKFKDGHEFTYTGSYELETLKFLDTVMNVKSEDLQVPGPVVNYDFQGKTHMYITDMYYIPYNLIIEVKDGGSSPNKNPAMAENRAKQMAKENWIIKKTEYNYLRLTDKDLSQLFTIFAELKFNLVENDPTRVIRVHEAMMQTESIKENMYAAMQGFMPMNPHDVVIVNYMKKNSYTGEEDDYAIAMDQKFDTIFARDESGILKKVDKNFLSDSIYTPYIVKNCRESVEEYIRNNINTVQMKSSIYEAVFGHKLYSNDQILFEKEAKKYKDYFKVLADTDDIVAGMIQPGLKSDIPEVESTFNEAFAGKRFNLNNFTKKKIDKSLCEKYKDKSFYQNLKYATYYDTDDGYVWFDKNDNYVGMVAVDKSEHPYWIFNLIVNKKYRGHGLGTQLLDFAVKSLGGEALSVKKTNDIAQNMYQKYGFIAKKTKNGDKDMNYMYLKSALDKKSTQKMLDEAFKFEYLKVYFITSDDGVKNACVRVKGYEKPMRWRSSMIPLKYEKGVWKAFFKFKDNEFEAPGGGVNEGETPHEAAIRECKEEARIVVKNSMSQGTLIEYHKEAHPWVKKHVEKKDWWYGYYTNIFVGLYDCRYTGKIAERDKDPEILSGRWYPVEDLYFGIPKEYKLAIENYIKYCEENNLKGE